ncbi:MAG TPA: TolC family protein [Caulobacteraceae bacterium]|nr:TolC family protein [Caulobacteraceae bacterium]
MMRATSLPALIWATLAVGACADAHMRTPDVRLPAAFEAPAGAADPTMAAATLDRWWSLFPDPQLQALIDQALANAPDARTAQARLEEAVAVRRGRLAGLLPQGDLQGSATEQHTERSGDVFTGGGAGGFNNSGDTQTLSANLNLSWELDLFGRLAQGRRYANADYAAARFGVEASRMSLAAQVAQSLFQARALAVQRADAGETARIAGELARVGRIRAERGLGPQADAARFQSNLDTAQSEIIRIDAALAVAKRTLLVLLGRGADPLDSLTVEARADAPPRVPASTPGDLLARRPDVRQAQARLQVETASVALSRLALFPTFTLQPGASLSRSFGATDSSTSVWSIGVGAVVPLLDRPRLLAELGAEKARGEQAVIAYEKAVQTAYGEAANALTTLQADQDRLVRLESADTQARFAFDAANRGYQAGLSDMTALLDAERTWRAARTALNGLRAQALQDAVAAFKALGGGWTSTPLQTANADRTR